MQNIGNYAKSQLVTITLQQSFVKRGLMILGFLNTSERKVSLSLIAILVLVSCGHEPRWRETLGRSKSGRL